MKDDDNCPCPGGNIEGAIVVLRGQKVMLDMVLAGLYGVETKALKRAVNRNKKRFPNDFMFRLNKEEYDSLRRQFGTLKRGAHAKYLPYAFTEQGIAMLSSVLRSERAIRVNIAIMRVFVRLRSIMDAHKEMSFKLAELEKRISGHDHHIKTLFDAIRRLMEPPRTVKKQVGFKVREKGAKYGK